ncbi:MAG: hypothetical protein K0R67_1857 [Paenibacillus sp.]|nr:hypothetical protein [Paenibacillus sp.]
MGSNGPPPVANVVYCARFRAALGWTIWSRCLCWRALNLTTLRWGKTMLWGYAAAFPVSEACCRSDSIRLNDSNCVRNFIQIIADASIFVRRVRKIAYNDALNQNRANYMAVD